MMPDSATDSAPLAVALWHARRGRRVFPCDPAHKRPAVPKKDGGRGFHDATTDEVRIRDWWARYPQAVPGMPTGAGAGVFVLDVDVKDGQVGEETLDQLTRTFGPLPDTATVLTASGGQHLYFLHPRDGREVPNKGGMLGQGIETWGRDGYPDVPFAVSPGGMLVTPGLDIRGDGGYVILPGAVMADGRSYEWEASSDPDDGDAKVAAAPDWLLALVVRDPTAAAPANSGPLFEDAPIESGARNDTLFRLGRSLRAKGLTSLAIEAALMAENKARCVPPLLDDEVRATAKSAASKPPGRSPAWEARERNAGDGTSSPELAVVGGTDYEPAESIRIVNGALPANVDAAEQVLRRSGAEIYQHGGRLVRVGRWDAVTGPVTRPTGAGVLIEIVPDWLVDKLTRSIKWERHDKRKDDWVRVDAPMKIAKTLLSRSGEWGFSHLLGFVDSPTLARDGRVISEPGYDKESGLYLSKPPKIEQIRTTDRSLAEQGRGTLEELVSTFAFASRGDLSACLALMMTAVMRRVLPSAPIGCVSASTPGTGKSLLVDCISVLATGRRAAVAALGKDGEELEKRIDAILLKGDLLCSFDNVDRAVKSDVLCQVTTQELKSVRVLAQSKMVDVPTNTLWMMTGNNLTLLGDLTRRCLMVHLDAGDEERPELRTFSRDAIAHVLRFRAEAIRAALLVAKAYIDAGCPDVGTRPYGSFEVWDRMVRRPLVWSGIPDPLEPTANLREEDHELDGVAELLSAIHAVVGDAEKTAAELYELATGKTESATGGWRFAYPDINAGYVAIMGTGSKAGPRELGYRLRAWAGRIVKGHRLEKGRRGTGGMRWRAVKLH